MTNEEIIKEISDALIAQGVVRNEETKQSTKHLESILSLYKQVRWLSWFNSLLCLSILLALLSCTHEPTRAEKLAKQLEIDKVQYNKTMDSIDLEIIKLGGKP